MTKTKKQALLISVIAIYSMVCVFLLFIPEREVDLTHLIEQSKSSIGEKEDVQSRRDYELEMLADPFSGKIPSGIKYDEIKFAKELDLRNAIDQVPNEFAEGQGAGAINTRNWLPIGPANFGGRTRALAFDIRSDQTVLAGGVSGGVWKTTELGATWFKTTAADQHQSVTCIAQDIRPGKENIWYYGTGELVGNSARVPGAPFRGDGIFKSTNNGDSWEPLPSTQTNTPEQFNSPFQYVWDITTNPNNGFKDEVLAAVWGGIVRSTDGGLTWSTVLGTDLLNLPNNVDLNDSPAAFYTDVHRTESGVFYASISRATNRADRPEPMAGVYRSVDGIDWEIVLPLINLGDEVIRRIEIASSPSNPSLLYFLADGSQLYRLWRYEEGVGVTDLSNNLPMETEEIEAFDSQDSYNLVAAVHPTEPNVVFIGGTNLYRSTDGFSSKDNTKWIGGYDPNAEGVGIYPNHHPDQHAIKFIRSFPDAMLTANDGGLFVSTRSLAEDVTYMSLNNLYVTTQFYTASISRKPTDNFVIGGTQDNGTLLTFNNVVINGPNGVRTLGGDGGFAATTNNGFYYYMSSQNGRTFRLTLNSDAVISSFARVDPLGGGSDPSQPYLFINPYVLDPNNSNRMYFAGGDYIWYNQNLSQIPSGSSMPTSVNWRRLDRTEVSSGSVISALQISTQLKDILYYGTSAGRLFRVENANNSLYQVVEITSELFPRNGYIRSIAIDPTDADHILVAFSNYGVRSLFRSTDGGESFTDVSGNLEENEDGTGSGPSIRWASIIPLNDGTHQYFVGTSTGLYSTNLLEGSVTWQHESPDAIGNIVVNMVDYRQSDGKIVIATHGNGLYTSQIENVVPQQNSAASDDFSIRAVYPNPFVDELTIEIGSPETQFIIVRIYDTTGNEVKRLTSTLVIEGENDFFWNGMNEAGQPVANGVYLVRVTYGQSSQTKQVILQR